MRRYIYFVLILFFANPLFAQDETPLHPIDETLNIAKTTYKAEIEQASQVLLGEIDQRISRVKDSSSLSVESQLEMLKELKDEREAFAADPRKIPEQRRLKTETSKYKRQLRVSKRTMEGAFDKAADDYRKPPLKDFEAVARVMEETKTFFGEAAAGSVEQADNVAFEPAFNERNWIASVPKSVKTKNDRLHIAAAKDGNIVLTKKTNFKNADVVVEVAAERGTEAYIVLNAQQKEDGQWTGVTSRIHFEEGKIHAGGQRTRFRPNSGTQGEFAPGDYFTLGLHVYQHGSSPDKALVKSELNGKRTGNTAYGWDKLPKTGAVGFVVLKGAISVKKFEASDPERE